MSSVHKTLYPDNNPIWARPVFGICLLRLWGDEWVKHSNLPRSQLGMPTQNSYQLLLLVNVRLFLIGVMQIFLKKCFECILLMFSGNSITGLPT